VPSQIITISEFGIYRAIEKIPYFYIDVYVHLMKERGVVATEEDAISYMYENVPRRVGWNNINLLILPDDEWLELMIEKISETKKREMVGKRIMYDGQNLHTMHLN
jgi:hypothetical protein